jgi:hypothetical protein
MIKEYKMKNRRLTDKLNSIFGNVQQAYVINWENDVDALTACPKLTKTSVDFNADSILVELTNGNSFSLSFSEWGFLTDETGEDRYVEVEI